MISVPHRLKWASMGILFAVPLALLQVLFFSRVPWAEIPTDRIQILAFGIGLASFILCLGAAQARRWAIHTMALLALLWTGATVLWAMQVGSFWLGCFSIFLGFYWTALWVWLRFEVNRSFMDPKISWYQGLPKPIPKLECELRLKNGKSSFHDRYRVSRLDRDGIYVFASPHLKTGTGFRKFHARKKYDILLEFEGWTVPCKGVPVTVLNPGPFEAVDSTSSKSDLKSLAKGVGIRFLGMDPDRKKELGDFVEFLKGEGYV